MEIDFFIGLNSRMSGTAFVIAVPCGAEIAADVPLPNNTAILAPKTKIVNCSRVKIPVFDIYKSL
jgi:hypothetical protein